VLNTNSPFDRPWPHDLDAELTVLGDCLNSPEALEQAIGLLAPADFYCSEIRAAWESVLALHRLGTNLDLVTLADHLKGRDLPDGVPLATLITALERSILPSNVAAHAAIVKRDADRRRLLKLSYETAQAAQAGHDLPTLAAYLRDACDALAHSNNGKSPELLTGEQWAALPAPQHLWLVEGIVACGAITVIAGAPETAKSFFVWDMARSATLGTDFLGQFHTSQSVWLIVDEENPADEIRRRSLRLSLGSTRISHMASIAVNRPEGEAQLRAMISRYHPTGVVLDSFTMTFLGDANKQEEVAPYFKALRRLQAIQTPPPAFVVVDHSRKLSAHNMLNRPDQLLPGSFVKKAAIDLFFFLRQAISPARSFRVTQDKARLGGHRIPDFAFRLTDHDEQTFLEWLGEPQTEADEKENACKQHIILHLRNTGGEDCSSNIIHAVRSEGYSELTIKRALTSLTLATDIDRIGKSIATRYRLRSNTLLQDQINTQNYGDELRDLGL